MKKINSLVLALIVSSGLMAQTVTSVTPGIAHPGATVTVTVVCTGMNFNSSSSYSITFKDSASNGVYTSFSDGNATVVNSTTITNDVQIPSQVYPKGAFNVVVRNNNTGVSATATGRFRITDANGINDVAIAGFRAYPVPATGLLHVDAATVITGVSLTSLSGQRVLSQADTAIGTVDIHGIAPGMYILTATDRSGAVSYSRIIIE